MERAMKNLMGSGCDLMEFSLPYGPHYTVSTCCLPSLCTDLFIIFPSYLCSSGVGCKEVDGITTV
jgi:hypothetical protein